LWLTPSFQECIDKQEKTERAKEVPKNPPEFPLSSVVYARIDTVCTWRTLYRFRDAIAAVATVFIAFFTLTLWLSTKRLSAEAIRASEIARRSADAAKDSAWAATKTVKEIRRNATHQLRAYLTIGILQAREQGQTIDVPVSNDGQTPAYEAWMHLNWERVAPGDILPTNFAYPDRGPPIRYRSRITIGAGTERTFTHLAPVDEMRRVLDGEIGLFIYGHIHYADIFFKEHDSNFCCEYFARKGDDGKTIHSLTMYGEHNDCT
jgi:hypothetical protein